MTRLRYALVGLAAAAAVAAVVYLLAPRNQPGLPAKALDALADELRRADVKDHRAVIVRHLGPAHRDVGSGFSIEKWDVGDVEVTHHQERGAAFVHKDGEVTEFGRQRLSLAEVVRGGYEVTTPPDPDNFNNTFWTGNVDLSLDDRYTYSEGGRKPDPPHFFSANPSGTIRLAYADGYSRDTPADALDDGATVAELTATAGGKESAFKIVARGRGRLVIEGPGVAGAVVAKGW